MLRLGSVGILFYLSLTLNVGALMRDILRLERLGLRPWKTA
jgi:hypothetical protein